VRLKFHRFGRWECGLAVLGDWSNWERIAPNLYRPFFDVASDVYRDRKLNTSDALPRMRKYLSELPSAEELAARMNRRKAEFRTLLFRVGPQYSARRLANFARKVIALCPRVRGNIFVIGAPTKMKDAPWTVLRGGVAAASKQLALRFKSKLRVYERAVGSDGRVVLKR
jgi:hypothetical protein